MKLALHHNILKPCLYTYSSCNLIFLVMLINTYNLNDLIYLESSEELSSDSDWLLKETGKSLSTDFKGPYITVFIGK